MVRLRDLRLGFNNLTGPIPTASENLASMEVLSLPSHRLSGAIPAAIGNLNRLISLSLHDNLLTGPLPAEITKLSALEDLLIHDNAGLCAPADAAFQDWLADLNTFMGHTCDAEPVPAIPPLAQILLVILLPRWRRLLPRSPPDGVTHD